MEEQKLAQQKVKKQQKIKKNDNVFTELNKEDIDFTDLDTELDNFDNWIQESENKLKD